MARWAYQWGPHDLYDYDGINENILLDLEIDGEERKVLIRPERNGYMYVLDRITGEVLSADPYEYITVTRGIDLGTGRPVEVEEKEPRENEVMREICPAAPGAKDWQPSAFATHGPDLRAASASLHGHEGGRDQLHRRHALRRSRGRDVCGTGRLSW